MAKRKKRFPRRIFRKSGDVAVGAPVDFTAILGAIVGGAAGGFANKIIPSALDKRLAAGIKVAVGAVLPMAVKDGKTKNMLSAVGSGLVAIGTAEFLQASGIISGIGTLEDDDVLAVAIEGIDDIPVISGGDDDIPVISGDDDEIDEINGVEADYTEVIGADEDEDIMEL